MFCPECGSSIEDDAKFCASCGLQLSSGASKSPDTQAGVWDSSYREPTSQSAIQSRYQANRRYDKEEVSPILYLCSFCVPIVGLVLFFVYRDRNSEAAGTMLVLGIIGFIIGLIINAAQKKEFLRSNFRF